MKYTAIIAAWLVVATMGASAQVASHASTAKPAAAAAAPGNVGVPADKPVARVNGVVLTDRDLLREMYTIFPYARQHNGFPKAQEASIRQGALEMIIFEELVYQEAVRRGVTIPPEKLRKAETEFRKQFSSPDEYQAFLAIEMQGKPELVRQKIRRSLMIEQLMKTDIERKSLVSVAEAKAYYDSHAGRFQVPESFSIQTISILPPRDAGKLTNEQIQTLQKRAQEALKQVKATKTYQDFGLLAEKISDDDFRVNMGDHKVVKQEDLPPEVVKMLRAIKPGTATDLIQVQNAYTIIRLNARTEPRKMTFEEVKASLREQLQKEKYERLRSSLAKQLRAKAKVEIV
jgi:peptidyl-prolyl cis-trans isomerase SurA